MVEVLKYFFLFLIFFCGRRTPKGTCEIFRRTVPRYNDNNRSSWRYFSFRSELTQCVFKNTTCIFYDNHHSQLVVINIHVHKSSFTRSFALGISIHSSFFNSTLTKLSIRIFSLPIPHMNRSRSNLPAATDQSAYLVAFRTMRIYFNFNGSHLLAL